MKTLVLATILLGNLEPIPIKDMVIDIAKELLEQVEKLEDPSLQPLHVPSDDQKLRRTRDLRVSQAEGPRMPVVKPGVFVELSDAK